MRDALAKVASGAHVAFATVRKGAGRGRRATGSSVRPASARSPSGSGRPGASHQRHGVPDVVDIGFTWLAGSAQRTPVNTEAKLLMMTHAFEVWEVHRVALQTDVRNKRSWAAIERIGGQLDGIMRGRPARRRRHRAHLGPLLHRGRGMAEREGPPDGAPGSATKPTDSAGGRAAAARSSVRPGRGWPRSCARCSACTAASASSLGRTAATALPVRWIFQASWSARSTVWPKISTNAWITVWNVVTSSFHTMTAHRSSRSKKASMSASATTGASMVEG